MPRWLYSNIFVIDRKNWIEKSEFVLVSLAREQLMEESDSAYLRTANGNIRLAGMTQKMCLLTSCVRDSKQAS